MYANPTCLYCIAEDCPNRSLAGTSLTSSAHHPRPYYKFLLSCSLRFSTLTAYFLLCYLVQPNRNIKGGAGKMTQWIKDPLHKCENLSLHLRTHVKWEVVTHVQNPRNLMVRWERETRDRRRVSLANSALNKRPCLNNVEGKDQCLRPPYMLLNICTTTTHTHTHVIFKRNHLNTQMWDLFV